MRRPARMAVVVILMSGFGASCVTWTDREADTRLGPAPLPETGAPAAAAAPARAAGPLILSVQQAVLTTIENNRSLRVQRFEPAIRRTSEEQARAAFDPTLDAGASASRSEFRRVPGASEVGLQNADARDIAANASVSEALTTGTRLSAAAGLDGSRTSTGGELDSARLGVSVTQSLLKGAPVAVNLASLRQARLDTLASEYELRGFAETLVADAEQKYWDVVLAERSMQIVSNSVILAGQRIEETRERIRVGALPAVELAAAEAELAVRREGLIDAAGNLDTSRLQLLRFLGPPGSNGWSASLTLTDAPLLPPDLSRLESPDRHAEVALRLRPEMNQARLSLQRGELEVVKTRNGLLPRLDLFVNLAKTGYADSFGGTPGHLKDSTYDAEIGVTFEQALGNRAARAAHERASLSLAQGAESLANLGQLVQLDIRTAYVDLVRARQQVEATAATRKLQEEARNAELAKFQVGKSTSFLVAQAERDLLAGQLAEVQAVVGCLKSLVNFYRLEGSLLERRGIEAPGRAPVDEHP